MLNKQPPGNLCLSRFPGESVVIGEDIILTVLSVHGGKVRIGITAPRDVPIDRSDRENKEKDDGK